MANKGKSSEKEIDENKIDKDIIDAEKYMLMLKEDLDMQKKKSEEYYDSLKRNMADFDNFKKRIVKEKESLHVCIVSDITGDLLPIMDNFEKALAHDCKDNNFKQGIEMIYSQLKDLITKYGVEELDDVGETFDPEQHEAVVHIDDTKYGEKEIVEVLRKGYKIKGKVIRHSMVKVAN